MIRGLAITLALLLVAPAAAVADDAAPALDRDQLAAIRLACETGEPTCDPVALLSPLERRAVDRALIARGLQLDRAPYGKRLGRIHVVSQAVFGKDEGFLRWFNHLHVTSKSEVITRELVVRTGEVWDQRRVDESARRLRDPVSTTLAALVPVRGASDDEVDLLVVTRDVWSLRMNSSYEIQEEQITYLGVAISENNLLGLHKLLAMTFRMDQGAYSIGPLYIDKNVAGKHLDLRGRGGPMFNRYTNEYEGSDSVFELARPLWSLDTKWGAGIAWSHRIATERSFRGNGLDTYDAPETEIDDLIPYAYRQRKASLSAAVVRGFGDDDLQQRVRGGYELAIQRPSLLEDFPDDPVLQESFTREVLPRSERTSVLFVGWELFEPRYRNFQNVSTFELAEDTRMGVELAASVGAARRLYGSEVNFIRASASAAYTGALGNDGLWRVAVSAATRLENRRAIDDVFEVKLRMVTPSIELGRLVTEAAAIGVLRDSQNSFFRIGGDSGLRGFPVGQFRGDRRAQWQTELRSRPIPVLFVRAGAVVFYDVGGAADTVDALTLHHDVGVGIRTLVPMFSPSVFRFDVAFPLDGPEAGSPRFSAGYEQSF